MVLVGLFGSCLLDRTAPADEAAESLRPMAPRGGVMMVPLPPRDGNAPWPAELTLTLNDDRQLTGPIGWITPQTHPEPIRWTRDPRHLSIRAIRPDDRAHPGRPGQAVLLVELPPDGDGPLHLGGRTLRPIWVDLPERPDADGDGGPPHLERLRRDDRPDPDSPFEYWRWVLLAERLERRPPPPPGSTVRHDLDRADGEVVSLLARHYADLWRAGIHRVERQRGDLGSLLRDRLTWTGDANSRRIALWVADPAETSRLLNLLLRRDRPIERLMDEVQDWSDAQDQIIIRIEYETATEVGLAILNPAFRRAVAFLRWDRPNEIPLAVELPPGSLTQTRIDRPAGELRPPSIPGQRVRPAARPDELIISIGDRTHTSTIGPRAIAVHPPGFVFPTLREPFSLYAIQRGLPAEVPPHRDLLAQVRRREGRWELYVECRRPLEDAQRDRGPAEPDRAFASDRPSAHAVEALRGQESFVLWIGDASDLDRPRIVLTVPETGAHEILVGRDVEGELEIHRRRYEDRWIARVVLPDDWLDLLIDQTTSLALLRTFAGRDAIATTPGQRLPWTDPVRRVHTVPLDLTGWSDLPLR